MAFNDDSPPPFKPDIPTEVYSDLFKDEPISPARRFLVENASETAKNIAWLVSHQKENSKVLEEIKTQCLRTNGRVLKLEDKNEIIEQKIKSLEMSKGDIRQIKEDIKLAVIAQKLAANKWFWVCVIVFLFGLYSLIVNAEIIKAIPILKSLFGG